MLNVKMYKTIVPESDFLGVCFFLSSEDGVYLKYDNFLGVDEVDYIGIPFARRRVRWQRESSPQGSRFQSIFEERIIDGVKKLVVTGKEDRKDFIEASKNETLIDNIIKRYQNGDVFALQKRQGFYGDVTGMPTDLASAHRVLISLENKFNSLPLSERQKFDNSFDKYVEEVSSYSVEKFNDVFNINKTVETNVVNESGDNCES